MTTNEVERQLRGALRETLDREQGPHPAWTESPAARRVAGLDRGRRPWPLRALAVAAVIGAVGGAALLAGALNQLQEDANGWVAYTVAEEDPTGGYDIDIGFTALDHEPRRVVGSDSDSVDQVCPAFSPDGHSLAYGTVEGNLLSGDEPASQNAALVIADVADDGTVSPRMTFDVGDGLSAPCPVWSPDGAQLALAVGPDGPSPQGSEVWILHQADGAITVIPDLLASDFEWSPNGTVLAIAGGPETARAADGNGFADGHIHLYELATGAMRTLDTPPSVSSLTWSPDGERIAYMSHPPSDDVQSLLWVIDLATGQRESLTAPYASLTGIGPVWSPDGQTIAYQRLIPPGDSERHEVVLVTPAGRSEQSRLASEVVMPNELVAADGTSFTLYPLRVSWSPDGAYLLYVARAYPDGQPPEEKWVVAVPTDPGAPAVVLATEAASSTMGMGFQVWQR